MNDHELARSLLDQRFGVGRDEAHKILETDVGARRIYDCAVDVIARLLSEQRDIVTSS